MAARYSAATERALQRVDQKQPIKASALAEGIDPSTLFRALKARRDSGSTAATQRRAVIVGAGALGRELAGWMDADGLGNVVFVDELVPGFVCTWIGSPARYVAEHEPQDDVFIAIADPARRSAIAAALQCDGATFIASSALVMRGCEIGAGSLLLPNSSVSADATLGRFVVLNQQTSIGHDVQLGDFCTLASHVDLMGHVKVGARAFFGSGSRVLPGLSIGDDAVVGAGAVVVRDVPAGATVFGNPARLSS